MQLQALQEATSCPVVCMLSNMIDGFWPLPRADSPFNPFNPLVVPACLLSMLFSTLFSTLRPADRRRTHIITCWNAGMLSGQAPGRLFFPIRLLSQTPDQRPGTSHAPRLSVACSRLHRSPNIHLDGPPHVVVSLSPALAFAFSHAPALQVSELSLLQSSCHFFLRVRPSFSEQDSRRASLIPSAYSTIAQTSPHALHDGQHGRPKP